MSDFTKEDLILEAKQIAEQFQNEYPKSKEFLTRAYYRKHSKLSVDYYLQFFESFKAFKESLVDTKTLKDFESEKRIIQLQQEISELKRDKDTLLKGSIDEDKILDIYQDRLLKINIPKELKIHPVKNSNQSEALLLLSDFHAGSVIRKEEVNGLNEYNIDIMKKRLDRVFHYAVYYCQKFGVKSITLAFLGDLWENSIHMETARTNFPNEVECLFILHEYLTEKLLQLEPLFSKINCHFVVGNHSRIMTDQRPYFKEGATMNWEYILAKQLQIQFKTIFKNDKTSKITITPAEALSTVICVAKRKFLLTHSIVQGGGGSFGGIPYYSVDRNAAKKFGVFFQIDDDSQLFSDVLSAHLHSTYKTKTISGYAYGNGSVVGTDPFSLEKMKIASEPEQTLLIVDRGIVVQEMILKCNDPFKGK